MGKGRGKGREKWKQEARRLFVPNISSRIGMDEKHEGDTIAVKMAVVELAKNIQMVTTRWSPEYHMA